MNILEIVFLIAVVIGLTVMTIKAKSDPKSEYHSIGETPNIKKKAIRERQIFFNDDPNDKKLYLAALSTIALFSWVMRRDGAVDKREMDVANLYFRTHIRYNIILSHYLREREDPILGHKHFTRRRCEELLNYYNSTPRMLNHIQCCENINRADIYYEAAVDLLKALFQVAYTSDGVIGSEKEILYEIAQKLWIKQEDWEALSQKYGFYHKDQQENKREDYSKNTNWTKYSYYDYSKDGKTSSETHKNFDEFAQNRKNEESKQQEEQTKKSSTFGYKLTQAYNQLGLLTTASESEIKKAYRSLAKKYHPDKLPHDSTDLDRKISTEHFQEIQEAYDYICLERGM